MTTTWTNGYQTEVNYTYGYYRDLSPNLKSSVYYSMELKAQISKRIKHIVS